MQSPRTRDLAPTCRGRHLPRRLVWGLSLAMSCILPAAHAGTTTLSDTTFDTGWQLAPGGGSSGSSGQRFDAGAPYYEFSVAASMTPHVPPNGLIAVSTSLTHDPATGAISEVTFNWDQQRFLPLAPNTDSVEVMGPALRQGSCVYRAGAATGTGSSGGWRARTHTVLGIDFGLADGAGCPTHPDFTFAGDVIEFGVYISLLGDGSAVEAGFDDFEVIIDTSTALLTVAPTLIDHGDVLVGQTSFRSLTVTNSGLASSSLSGTFPAATIPHAPGTGQAFGPLGQNTSTNRSYSFTPTERGGIGVTPIVTSDGGSQAVTFFGRGVAPILQVDASGAAGGPVRVGTTAVLTVVVDNTGDGNDSSIGSDSNLKGSLGPAAAPFGGTGAPIDLPDGGSSSIFYSYTPADRAPNSQVLNATFTNGHSDGTNGPQTVEVELTGTGVGPVFGSTPVPSSPLDFGPVLVGASDLLQLEIRNDSADANGGDPSRTALTVVSTLGAPRGNPLFEVISTPGTLAAGNTASLELRFTPPSIGVFGTNLDVTSDEGRASGDTTGPTYGYNVAGRGVAPRQSVGGSGADAGPTRVGTSGLAVLVVSNLGDGNTAGGGTASNLNGTAAPVTGTFVGPTGGGGFSVPDGSSVDLEYPFTPSSRTSFSEDVTVSFTNGRADGTNQAQSVTATISGQGVGPVFETAPVADAPLVITASASGGAASVEVMNTSNDPSAGDLARLTVGAYLTGPDADAFSVPSSPLVVASGGSATLEVTFSPPRPGQYLAELVLVSDEGRAFGDLSGTAVSIPLEGGQTLVAIPVTSPFGTLLFILLLGWVGWRIMLRA